MIIQQFKLLHESKMEEIILEEGVLLARHDVNYIACDIYKLYDFYVAFCYQLYTIKRIFIAANLYLEKLPSFFERPGV